jgi:hypothetical protein
MKRALSALALVLGGCATHSLHPLRPLEIPTAPYNGIPTAALTGSLMYEGGCLLFRDEGNRIQLMPVWPDGSSFNGTSVTFHEPGKTEQRIIVGEEFLMEGQPIQWGRVQNLRAPAFAEQCARQPFAILGVHPAN